MDRTPPKPRASLPALLVCLALLLGLGLALLPGGALAAEEARPSCAEGPQREGGEIVGTACDDTIVVPAAVTSVDAGPGDDTIRAATTRADSISCPGECHLGVGSQTFEGGPGDDLVFGERGNDSLLGGAGNDRLYGGIGDDKLLGGEGDDRLLGGFGADSIDGQVGNDYARGDGTIDRIFDTGGGVDTLSYATAVTPGFGGGISTGVTNFPTGANGERGVYLQLGVGGQNANNGEASFGGGVDEVEAGVFETIIGSPFSDFIVGTANPERIYGGGGADVVRGNGGGDTIYGGADGDFLESAGAVVIDGGAGSDHCPAGGCEQTSEAVTLRDATKVSVGLMAPEEPGGSRIYVVGAGGGDNLTLAYGGSFVALTLSGGSFDQSADDAGGCTVIATTANCPLAAPLESVLVAGMAGDDAILAENFPSTASVVLLGGQGGDGLTATPLSEDVLVDGPEAGADTLSAFGGDDALVHNGGADQLFGGEGNDLFLSVSICDGETINGENGRDNSSWARLKSKGVEARLDTGLAGDIGGCGGKSPDSMTGIEDMEGSESADVFYGDANPNQLLGHLGADSYFAQAGADNILANSGDADAVINCGADIDNAIVDLPQYGDPAPIECESVRQGNPNEFNARTELPPPPLVVPPPPPVDRKAPQTRISFRPAKLVVAKRLPRRVVFRFAANERGSAFKCRIDRKPFRPCKSPRAFNVGRGAHTVKVFAIDPAGNRDRTPVVFSFKVRLSPQR